MNIYAHKPVLVPFLPDCRARVLRPDRLLFVGRLQAGIFRHVHVDASPLRRRYDVVVDRPSSLMCTTII